jgi:PAS domain S-box-containing protein
MSTHTTPAPPTAPPAPPRLLAAARLAARAAGAPVGAVHLSGALHVHAPAGLGDAGREALAGLCRRAAESGGGGLFLAEITDQAPGIAAFAGVPLAGGGCVAVAGPVARGWSGGDRAALADAAALLAPAGAGRGRPHSSRQGIGVFRAMFAGSDTGIAVLDLGGRILRANRSLARMMGAPPARLFGRPLAAYLRSDADEAATLAEALAHGREADVHDGLRLRARGGAETWVRLKVTIRSRAGRPVFALALVEDVGERRRAAEVLGRRAAVQELMQRVSAAANRAGSLNEVLREALELTCRHTGWPVGHVFVRGDDGELESSGVWRVDDPGRFAALRDATSRVRITRGEGLVGRVEATRAPVWSEDVQAEPAFLRGEAAALVGLRGAVAWPICAGEEVVAVAEFFSGRPQRPDAELMELLGNLGTQLGLVVERERAVHLLRESEARLFQFMEAIPAGVLIREAGGQVYYANRAARELLGRAPDEEIDVQNPSRTHAMFVTGTDLRYPTERLPMINALAGRAVSVDDLEVRPGGRRVPLHVDAAPIFGAGGRVAYAVAAFVDITERLAMETTLREHARELERSNRELEEFAYVASHDLQEPLRKIRAFGDRLHQGFGAGLGEDGRDYLARMQAAAARMQQLIQELLQYSRVGRQPAQVEPVGLDAVLAEVLADLEPRLRGTGARVSAAPLGTVRADPTLMRQLLQNLLANALKFHRAGIPPEVRVETEAGDDGRTVRLTVADRGIGFEPAHAERIFLPFQRLHGRSEYEGTGMGLAICRRIAEAAGGAIQAHGEPGVGATFTVTLPACAGRAPEGA